MTLTSKPLSQMKWRLFFEDNLNVVTFFTLLLIALLVLAVNTVFLMYAEVQDGHIIDDWLLKYINPMDVSYYLFGVTYAAMVLGIGNAFKSPHKAQWVILTTIFIVIMRMMTMFCLPLEPPDGIIPLRDPFLEYTFYHGDVITRDLFFSGHTASIFSLALIVENRKMKIFLLISTGIVAFLLLLQHVHYTVDILAAIPFSMFAVWMARKTLDKIIDFQISLKTHRFAKNHIRQKRKS
ncbi:MAG TPA: phosphatase PAP2-related protein [Saprospiraceae bacterium]|nr:phosphatase PAP2-related protein [Saprospiraceae bacterium]